MVDVQAQDSVEVPGGGNTLRCVVWRCASPGDGARRGPTAYTVVSGDYLYGIAAKHRVRLADLLAANGLQVTSLILPGQTLKLPAGATAPTAIVATPAVAASAASGNGASTYTIVAGDTLSGIAGRAGVTLSALLTLNNLTVTSLILPGRTLQLPSGATPPAAKAAVTTATTAAAPAASTGTYTVRPNDSLSLIAWRASVRLSELLALNGLTLSAMIHPGDQLKLPAGATVSASPSVAPANGVASVAPSTTSTTSSAAAAASAPTGTGVDAVLAFARAQLGKPYAFFTAGPDTYDCSGLVKAAYAVIGYQLPHQSYAQSKFGTAVDWNTEPIRAGDLVFKYSSTNLTQISHVGIAISSTQMIDAPRTGIPVRIGPMPSKDTIVAVQRLIP